MLIAFGVDARAWTAVLDRWLTFRRGLATDHGLPKGYELHAGTFVTGRGWPNEADPRAAINRDKGLRRQIYEQALDVIAVDTQLSVHTVHHVGRQDRYRIYRALLDHLDDWLSARGDVGVVAMDGNDQFYAKVHRSLPLGSPSDRRGRLAAGVAQQPVHPGLLLSQARITPYGGRPRPRNPLGRARSTLS